MTKKVLFFDSGIGGLSTLAQALKICPTLSYVFVADNKHAPFGKLSQKRVLCHTQHCLKSQINSGEIGAVVLACNTATNCALDDLKTEFNLPLIGVEPAIKQAVDATPVGKILVLATPTTMAQTRFKTLSAPFKTRLILSPQPTLATLIEDYFETPTKAKQTAIISLLKSLKNTFMPSAVVLGCTHYSLIKPLFEKIFNTQCFDSNLAIANELLKIIGSNSEFFSTAKSYPLLLTTAPTKTNYTKILRHLLSQPTPNSKY